MSKIVIWISSIYLIIPKLGCNVPKPFSAIHPMFLVSKAIKEVLPDPEKPIKTELFGIERTNS